VLLETGGGIKNASNLIGDESFIVYNGDVLADIPLDKLIFAHANGNRMATLALRSEGAERRIQCDVEKGIVTDMRGLMGGRMDPSFLFTGISIFSPEIFNHIPEGEIISIIPVLVEILRAGNEIGGVLIDDGAWFDIGNVDAYIEAHAILSSQKHCISYLPDDWIVPVDPTAIVKRAARFSGFTCIGAGATIGEEADLHDVIVWQEASVEAGVHLQKSVVI
jgi:NDP-sugar pyrophosphorylase family protein